MSNSLCAVCSIASVAVVVGILMVTMWPIAAVVLAIAAVWEASDYLWSLTLRHVAKPKKAPRLSA